MNLKNNITKNYIFTILSNMSITDAIWILFLAYRGMNLVQIGLLESVFHITSMAMELPTGIIADQYGRKTSRVLGRVLGLFSTIGMLYSHSFLGFAMSFFLSALSYNLESGAGEALVYDTLLVIGKEDKFTQVQSYIEVCFQSAKVISLLVGGIVATFNYELGYYISIGINILAVLSALTFKEPKKDDMNKKYVRIGLFEHVQCAIKIIKVHRSLIHYILFFESIALFTTTIYFYLQTFMKANGLSEFNIGIFLSFSCLLSGVSALGSDFINRYFKRQSIILLSILIMPLSILIMAVYQWGYIAYLIIGVLDSILSISFSTYINAIIPSEQRATLLSFSAMVFSSMMIVYFPIFGYVVQQTSFKIGLLSMFFMALLLLIITGTRLCYVIKNKEY